MTTRYALVDRLATQSVVWLDGGLATELDRRGHDLDDPLWSAALLLSAPDAITAAHTAYLEAGADVIVTASYQASDAGLSARGLSLPQIDAVYQRSTALARQARDAFAAAHPDLVPHPRPRGRCLRRRPAAPATVAKSAR